MKNLKVETACWEKDKDALIKLRAQVFVDEQNVPPSIEIDGLDPECKHVKATADGMVIGTGRLLPDGHIGRMCIRKNYRQYGIGSLLLKNLVAQALNANYPRIALNSQSYAIPFYEKNGFVVDSEEFMDAGIPHRRMILDTA
ncbi:MAG: GNAT family N-acetyltransferase [Gammaproteobacteria bacterium]|nr:GNAT family N-acetyltransferase [Gammaproteobacteria bacterium]